MFFFPTSSYGKRLLSPHIVYPFFQSLKAGRGWQSTYKGKGDVWVGTLGGQEVGGSKGGGGTVGIQPTPMEFMEGGAMEGWRGGGMKGW